MIYSLDGSQLDSVFSLGGSALTNAYDVNANEIWTQLKVMSFNVGSWYGYADYVPDAETETYYSMYDHIFESQNADVVGIQEYCSRFGTSSGLTLLQSNYEYVYALDRTTNPSKAGKANASKIELSNNNEVVFTNNSGEERSFLVSTFHSKGKTIYFLNTHLSLTASENLAQLQELIDYVENKEYWIMTGDFNVRFDTAESEAYTTHIQPFLNLGYHVANGADFGFLRTFYSGNEGHCVDNIYTSANIDILDAYVDETKLNATLPNGIDHVPLIAELQIN